MDKKIGQQLADARKARSLSITQVAEATHISERYLIALEAGDFDALPSRTQAKGFLRIYAGFLGLHVNDLSANNETEEINKQEQIIDHDAEPLRENVPEKQDAEKSEVQVDKSKHKEKVEPENQKNSNQSLAETEEKEQPGYDSYTPLTSKDAEGSFKEVGEILKKQREMLSLSLLDVEYHTHVRVRYLEALEAGDIDSLPSPVQGRGMLKNYATFIGLDPDPLLLQYAKGLQQQLAARHGISSSEFNNPERYDVANRSGFRRFFSGDLLIGIAGTLVFILVVLWGQYAFLRSNPNRCQRKQRCQ